MTDANAGLKAALVDYVRLEHAPHYAVLVTGPWGIGKTYVVRRCLDEAKLENGYYYVSLFGAETKSDIDAAIFKAVHPAMTGKAARVGGAVLKSVLKFGGVESDLSLEKILDGIKGGLYVFDDLERAELSIGAILGYINEFVEHDDCRIVLIANTDHKMDEDEVFRTQREKLVGRTLKVQSALADAYNFFLTKITDPDARAVLERSTETVLGIYEGSQAENLRVLQQSLWDFERLYRLLAPEHKAEADIVDRLLRLMLGFGIETKMGRLGREGIMQRSTRFASMFSGLGGKDKASSPIVEADGRYAMVDLFDPLLSNEILVATLLDGVFDAKQVQASINLQPPFRKDGPPPAWQVLAFGAFQEDEVLSAALETHKSEFAGHAYDTPEIVLHLFSIRRRLARLGLIDTMEDAVADELIAYVDAIQAKGELAPIDPLDVSQRLDHGGTSGVVYSEPDHPDFRRLKSYLEGRCHEVFHASLAGDAPQLLDLMEEGSDAYLKAIAHGSGGGGKFADSPVFAAIRPADWVDRFVALDPRSQQGAASAMFARYRYGALNMALSGERDFVRSVVAELAAREAEESGFGKERLTACKRYFELAQATIEEGIPE
ncbi:MULTISPECIES: P-loop NTPase fold protein [Hyphomonas]|uniref:KAP NTPase domain-containing protein n=1 Tax=Hyphomonas adhaerens TaxID=81029 RepID=A0A3B9GTR3_9PROT|nr:MULTISPECIES: P-loop NTPase fold protein [Hyphomonas]KCZ47938.1 hypothetical protein HY17_05515 [Hyphomonas sp. CY54-11-8]MBB41566.1 hypothetical protein [Hyphomonas sp.]HAE25860.1 hypothetical protein [Hyphomonas adhaerens]|tara:strand:- start:473 stop:2287 length:1815 start_codon:yes stop_codon:yes gene_type:complete